jgi:hypothetical protein
MNDLIVHRQVGDLTQRERVVALEQAILVTPGAEAGETPAGCTLRHFYAPGMYAREITIPAGVVVTGRIHRHSHVNTISRGIAHVVSEFGSFVYDATDSTQTFVSEAGTKRAVFAQETVVWTTYHPTGVSEIIDDPERLVAMLTVDSFAELDALPYAEVKRYIQ